MEEILGISEAERLVQRIRKINPERLVSLCRMHLSFILDLPSADFTTIPDSLGNNYGNNAKKSFKLRPAPFRKKSKDARVGSQTKFQLSQYKVLRVNELIAHLERPSNVSQVGLFRKSGKLSRQNELKMLLNSRESLSDYLKNFTLHDCANVLKSFFKELPEPLLGEEYYAAHCQISDLCKESMPDDEKIKAEKRQILALQLLLLLLPHLHYQILQSLLLLLHRVAQESQNNKMDSLNLGTLFAPHILCPRKMTAEDLHRQARKLTKATAFLIANAPKIFEIPKVITEDLNSFLEKEASVNGVNIGPSENTNSPDSGNAVHTVITFCDRQKASEINSKESTDVALANLYAHIQSLPESVKKKHLVKQFNKENGKGTPTLKKHSRSKSVRESLKRHILKNHQREKTTHFYIVNGADKQEKIPQDKITMASSEESQNLNAVANNEVLDMHNINQNMLETIRHPAFYRSHRFKDNKSKASSCLLLSVRYKKTCDSPVKYICEKNNTGKPSDVLTFDIGPSAKEVQECRLSHSSDLNPVTFVDNKKMRKHPSQKPSSSSLSKEVLVSDERMQKCLSTSFLHYVQEPNSYSSKSHSLSNLKGGLVIFNETSV